MLQQRLRWAQGTIQVMLRENPLLQRGLSAGQRLMYFGTMCSYLSGFAAVVYIAAPGPLPHLRHAARDGARRRVPLAPRCPSWSSTSCCSSSSAGAGRPGAGSSTAWRCSRSGSRRTTAIVQRLFGREARLHRHAEDAPGRRSLRLVRPQLSRWRCCRLAGVVGLVRLALGMTDDACRSRQRLLGRLRPDHAQRGARRRAVQGLRG